jgi:hypothetical protein
MSNNKSPSAFQQARAEKQKTAAVEGAKAMADRTAQDGALRKNMERLRALRLAKEAEEAALAADAPPKAKKAKAGSGTKAAAAAKPKGGKGAKGPELSAWLEQQKASGQRS